MSTNAILSPMQQDYVNKEEFGEFKEEFYTLDSYVRDGFGKTFEQIDNVESILIDKIDGVESRLGKKIDIMAGDVSWLKRSVGKLMKKAGV
jgi:hypothetical protein